jgi:heme-degrading monooxygenase HmoA
MSTGSGRGISLNCFIRFPRALSDRIFRDFTRRKHMFIVMNRFQVNKGRDSDFETSWQTRERHLSEFEGFVSFSLLKNWLAGEGTTEYISHTIWASRQDFEVWRDSDQFRQAHAGGSTAGVLAGPPAATLYQAVLEEHNARRTANV